MFTLHPQLAADSHPLCQRALCDVQLMNDSRFPWLILVPRIAGAVEWFDISDAEQRLLHLEVMQVAKALKRLTGADKMNIAALGNVVPQLHVHVVARFKDDGLWPAPVWGKGIATPYTPEALQDIRANWLSALV